MEIALHRTYLYKFSIPQGERICTFLLPKEKKNFQDPVSWKMYKAKSHVIIKLGKSKKVQS